MFYLLHYCQVYWWCLSYSNIYSVQLHSSSYRWRKGLHAPANENNPFKIIFCINDIHSFTEIKNDVVHIEVISSWEAPIISIHPQSRYDGTHCFNAEQTGCTDNCYFLKITTWHPYNTSPFWPNPESQASTRVSNLNPADTAKYTICGRAGGWIHFRWGGKLFISSLKWHQLLLYWHISRL